MKISIIRSLKYPMIYALLSMNLTACETMGALSKSELETIYGPIKPHWIGPKRNIGNLIELGYVQDPATTDGKIKPVGEHNLEEPRWLSEVGLNNIKVFIRPTIPPSQTWNFGPKAGAPIGIYIYEIHNANAPVCEEYNEAMVAAFNFYKGSPFNFSKNLLKDKCLTYRYGGPLNITEDNYIHIYWFSESLKGRGCLIRIEELRRGESDVVARSVSCSVADAYPWQPRGCPGNNDLMALFVDQSEGQ